MVGPYGRTEGTPPSQLVTPFCQRQGGEDEDGLRCAATRLVFCG